MNTDQNIIDVTTYTLEYVDYTDESILADIQRLVAADLSEPYSVFTYRYFLHNWPKLCMCVYANHIDKKVGNTLAIGESKRVLIGIAQSKLTNRFNLVFNENSILVRK